MKEVSEATGKSITLMRSKETMKCCQQSTNKTMSTSGASPEIQGISKTGKWNTLLPQTEEMANLLRGRAD
jgi:hypothetical protein